MTTTHNQSGFGHIVAFLAILAILVIGYSGYTVYTANQKTTSTSSTTTASTTTNTSVPTTIKSKADLQQAAAALNTSGGQAQSQLNSTSLNSSISDML